MEKRDIRIQVNTGSLEAELVLKNIPEVLTPEQFEVISDITRTLRALNNKGKQNLETIQAIREPGTYTNKPRGIFKLPPEFIKEYAEKTRGLSFDERFERFSDLFCGQVTTRKDLYDKEWYMKKKNNSHKLGLDLHNLGSRK